MTKSSSLAHDLDLILTENLSLKTLSKSLDDRLKHAELERSYFESKLRDIEIIV